MNNITDFHEHVRRLFIKPDDATGRSLHAAVGISGEAGELLGMVKANWIYGREFDHDNMLEECGDLLFYIAAMLDTNGLTLHHAMQNNYDKLKKRYPDGYTDKAANERADKS
jgi:NTP pyrophosphatase (non-canonical NTP hydrolase)